MPVSFRQHGLIIDALTGGTHEWTPGTGSQGIFTVNGTASESERVWSTDPWGRPAVVWETHPDSVSGADGGWVTDYFPIDNTKLYRFSVWARTTSSNAGTDDGRFYLGCTGSPTHVDDMDNCATNTNPYWWGGAYLYNTFTQYKWYLFVGHVWPSDAKCQYGIDEHINSGRWSIEDGKIEGPTSGHDFRFNPATTSIRHRTYHFYATDTNARLQFYDPRIELCDGSEGTIESLLNGPGGVYSGNTLATDSVTPTGGSLRNQHVDATGGDSITEVGQWRIHKFTTSGNFVVNSFVGSALRVDYLIVAGGGGAGDGDGGNSPPGGGGAGGVLSGYCYLTGTTYAVTVGGGGASATVGANGTNGSNSTFNGLTAIGGGGGAGDITEIGSAGGSGGGGSWSTGGAGTAGQGNNGGDGFSGSGGGGGGGFSSAGTAGDGTNVPGGSAQKNGVEGQPILYGGGGYGGDLASTVTSTGSDASWIYMGYYGWGANGPDAYTESPYDGNGGIVVIRYKCR